MTHRPSRTVWRKPALLVGALTALLCGAPAHSGERLSGTWGVSQIEGAGGGGLKWRVFGDAVYDQDKPWPQIAIGAQFKHNPEFAIPAALGAAHARDSDFYVAATKVWLAGLAGHNTLANLTLRSSRANQFGLLGFGGPQSDRRSWRAELSLAVLLRDDLALGGEWRDKPNNLASSREDRAADLFAAWFVNRHLSLTLAWVDLGNVANKPGQRGAYLSLQGALKSL